MEKVLILGATSAIGRALADRLAARGDRLLLAGRSEEELRRLAADLRIRHSARVEPLTLDALDFSSHESFVRRAVERLEGLDGVVWLIGQLGTQPADSHDPDAARRLIESNFTAAVSLLAPLANHLAEQGSGFIVGFSSVAGDRGRQSNYAYGAAKGGLSLYLQGLRNRLDAKGVRVYTVKPGFVDTAMTYGMKGLFLVASPRRVAETTLRLLKRSAGVHYVPWFWRPIMWIIRLIPEPVFKRLPL